MPLLLLFTQKLLQGFQVSYHSVALAFLISDISVKKIDHQKQLRSKHSAETPTHTRFQEIFRLRIPETILFVAYLQ